MNTSNAVQLLLCGILSQTHEAAGNILSADAGDMIRGIAAEIPTKKYTPERREEIQWKNDLKAQRL